jgi:hypothetical protein
MNEKRQIKGGAGEDRFAGNVMRQRRFPQVVVVAWEIIYPIKVKCFNNFMWPRSFHHLLCAVGQPYLMWGRQKRKTPTPIIT